MSELATVRKESYWYSCTQCQLCGKPMDHPPITIAIDRPVLHTIDQNLPGMYKAHHVAICRLCVLEALAPIDTPDTRNAHAGWYHREILSGGLEPAGVETQARQMVTGERQAENPGPTNPTSHKT